MNKEQEIEKLTVALIEDVDTLNETTKAWASAQRLYDRGYRHIGDRVPGRVSLRDEELLNVAHQWLIAGRLRHRGESEEEQLVRLIREAESKHGEGAWIEVQRRSLGFLVQQWAERFKIILGPHSAAGLADVLAENGYIHPEDFVAATPHPKEATAGELTRDEFDRRLKAITTRGTRSDELWQRIEQLVAATEARVRAGQQELLEQKQDFWLKQEKILRATITDMEAKLKASVQIPWEWAPEGTDHVAWAFVDKVNAFIPDGDYKFHNVPRPTPVKLTAQEMARDWVRAHELEPGVNGWEWLARELLKKPIEQLMDEAGLAKERGES